MDYKTVVVNDNDSIKDLLKRLNLKPGDRIYLQEEQDGSLRIIKEKNEVQEFSELLEKLHKEMQADNFLEEVGLSTEEDIAEYIRQIRHEKSTS